MDSPSAGLISSCRHCRHYTPEGRRGGHCGQLDALVHGDWKACPFAVSAFPAHWNLSSPASTPLAPSADLMPANSMPAIAAQGFEYKNSGHKDKNFDDNLGKGFKQESFDPMRSKRHKNLEVPPSGNPQPVTTNS